MPDEFIAQLVSILAMLFSVTSYQWKDKRIVILMQLFGAVFFGVSYFMLGAITGGILNVVAIIRSVVYLLGRRVGANSPIWLLIFGGAYVASFILTFTVFGKPLTPLNLFVEALPPIAMLLITVGYAMPDSRGVRLFCLIASPFWLAYNIITFSLGGIVSETISLGSIIVAMLRYGNHKGDTV